MCERASYFFSLHRHEIPSYCLSALAKCKRSKGRWKGLFVVLPPFTPPFAASFGLAGQFCPTLSVLSGSKWVLSFCPAPFFFPVLFHPLCLTFTRSFSPRMPASLATATGQMRCSNSSCLFRNNGQQRALALWWPEEQSQLFHFPKSHYCKQRHVPQRPLSVICPVSVFFRASKLKGFCNCYSVMCSSIFSWLVCFLI